LGDSVANNEKTIGGQTVSDAIRQIKTNTVETFQDGTRARKLWSSSFSDFSLSCGRIRIILVWKSDEMKKSGVQLSQSDAQAFMEQAQRVNAIFHF
jgi:hypothetical protein